MRSALLTFLLFLSLHAARGEPLWQTLPPTPAPVPGEHIGHAKVNGISLYYATIGHGSPVVLLHGGLANSDYWGNQIKACDLAGSQVRPPAVFGGAACNAVTAAGIGREA